MRFSSGRWLLVLVWAWVACGSENGPASKHPGELGAPCSSKADCNGDSLCTTDVDAQQEEAYCYVECDEDGACPEGNLCVMTSFVNAQQQVTRTQICQPRCSDDAFCIDVHPDRPSCQAWNGVPVSEQSDDEPTYCGIGG